MAKRNGPTVTRPDLSTDVNALVEVARWPGPTLAPEKTLKGQAF
jgi:hypothetical protein